MLTPRFEVTQTDAEVAIIIHAPYANIKDTEVYVDGTDFRFYSTPYYLRLKLPGEIEENDSSFGAYDCEKGDFSLRFPKVVKGEHFENLDMISTLLAPPKKKATIVSNIEVIGNPSANSEDMNDMATKHSSNEENTNGDEWYIHQNSFTETVPLLPTSPKYGFASKVSGALDAFEPAWIKEIIDLPMPDTVPQSERKKLREKCEISDFNEEHYLADLMQPCIEPYISFIAEWDTLKKENVSFNKTEVDLLKELPNKEYLLNNEETYKLLLSLIDILFGNCYNHRTTLGENTVESSWTISKLSSTLSWFDEFSDPKELMKACFRRSICYPLFRNWNLSEKVFEDVKKVIKLGKKYIIKRFCEIHSLFNNSYEPRYILNQLYIKDYLIWLQQINESLIESLESLLINIQPCKEEMDLDLVQLEQAAYFVQEEDLIIENSVHEMVNQMDELTVNEPKTIYYIKDKHSLKYLLSSSSSSSDSSDTDSETDSESTTSSTTTTSNSNSLDSDDIRGTALLDVSLIFMKFLRLPKVMKNIQQSWDRILFVSCAISNYYHHHCCCYHNRNQHNSFSFSVSNAYRWRTRHY
ncbi:PREDICTED: protein SHQ1 homolog [Eufriesea mexicana]|uniref:protein SHQ1 homolog n=1 Tax=Eufriesea mexicana TaxID=516756 RepID=UPI00083C3773|nr:PREDICTED: protein SHQ1 homolog [Eufriesea mexicana]